MAQAFTRPVREISTAISSREQRRPVRRSDNPPSCTDCFETWEPQTTGNLRACPGLSKDIYIYTLLSTIFHIIVLHLQWGNRWKLKQKFRQFPFVDRLTQITLPMLHPHTLALKGIPYITISLNICAVILVNFKNTQLDKLIIIIITIIIKIIWHRKWHQ